MDPLKRLPTYIGREEEQSLLRLWTRTVAETHSCRVLYFEAAGGLGKTFLLEKLPDIVQPLVYPDEPGIVIAPLIDMYSFDQRIPAAIEAAIIDGLERPREPRWYHPSADAADAAFSEYHAMRQAYERAAEAGLDGAKQQLWRTKLADAFVAGWNALAAHATMMMRLDTIEVLFDERAPERALIERIRTGAALVQGLGETAPDWLVRILPRLERTLVVLCGRPRANAKQLTGQLASLIVEASHTSGGQALQPLTEAADIRAYLNASSSDSTEDVSEDEIAHIKRSSEGQPLLLSCYARLRKLGAIRRNLTFPSRHDFERFVLDTILDPLAPTPAGERAADSAVRRGVIYCLYLLSYARRGLRRANLVELLRAFGLVGGDAESREQIRRVLAELDDFALVKRAAAQNSLTLVQPDRWDTGLDDIRNDELLLLHDEVFQLIDSSGRPDEHGLSRSALDYLAQLSRAQVRAARERGDRPAAIKAMSDHLYYELVRDAPARGYWTAYVYIDLALRERQLEVVRVLSDTFWSTLTMVRNRGDRTFQPLLDAMRAAPVAQRDDAISYERVLAREDGLYVKWMRLTDGRAAMTLADELYATLPDPRSATPDQIDWFMHIDLLLTRADLIRERAPASRYTAALEDYDYGIALLKDAEKLPDALLRLRSSYFLGLAYTYRGQLLRLLQRFRDAADAGYNGRKAYLLYEEECGHADGLNDYVQDDISQAQNNEAYSQALAGNLVGAATLSFEVVQNRAPTAPAYRRALWRNTYAMIRILRREYSEAETALDAAEKAALEAGMDRPLGLVARARGQLMGAQLKDGPADREQILTRYQEASAHYQSAKALLRDSPGDLREMFYDEAGLERDIYNICYHPYPEARDGRRHMEMALDLLDRSIERVPPPTPGESNSFTTHWLNVTLGKVVIWNNIEAYERSEQALDQIQPLLADPLPPPIQVLRGKYELQRAYLLLFRDHRYQEALQRFCAALTHVRLHSAVHRDIQTFSRLVESWVVAGRIPQEELMQFKAWLKADAEHAAVVPEVYAQQIPARNWDREWSASSQQLLENLDAWLRI